MSKHHNIKLRACFVDAIYTGRKSFEIRKDDRDYQLGDTISFIRLTDRGQETPLHGIFKITYITEWEQKPNYVVFAIKRIDVQADQVMVWRDMSSAPRDGSLILLGGENHIGRFQRIIGYYVNKYTLEADSEADEDTADYSEESGMFYCIEGWYESICCNDEYCSWRITKEDCNITSWMPLPAAPTDGGQDD